MNQPEHELARKLVRYLDDGVDQLEPGVRARLAAARRNAMSRYRERHAAVFGLAWAGRAAARLTDRRFYSASLLIAATVFVLAMAGVMYWQGARPTNGLADLDASLLTDDLPINAYLDKGFDSWLKRSSR